MINDHRQWLYDTNGNGRIFEEGEEIPEGWTDQAKSDEWDNPPCKCDDCDCKEVPGPGETFDVNLVEKQPKEPAPQKYPSQMNKAELVTFGRQLGLDLDEKSAKSELYKAVNQAIEDA